MWLLALLFVPTLCAAQSLRIMPPGGSHAYDLTESNRKTIIFTCVASDAASANTLQWSDPNNQQIAATSGRVLVYRDGNSKILQIARPQDSDAGSYTCSGIVEGENTEASIKLELYKGISNTSPMEQYPKQGTDAKIMCNVSASIQYSVKWFTGDLAPIMTGDRYFQMSDHLLVKNIQLSDSGYYVCQCSIPNLGITQQYNISVTVTIPPTMQGPITQQPATPKEGDNLELICLAEGTPAPTYMYYKGNVPIRDEPSTNGKLNLEKVTRDNEGIYTCVATNRGGEARQDVKIDIRIPPKIEPINNVSMETDRRCELVCVAKGDPKPNLFWRRKDRQDFYSTTPSEDEEIHVEESSEVEEENDFTSITKTTLKLIIPSLQPEDSFEYVCKAENEVGMEEKTGRIDVQYPPNFSDQPSFGTSFYGWLGGTTNLTCVANGNPEPVISWFYKGAEVRQGTDYNIFRGTSNNPTKAISYLIPNVRAETVDKVFGTYTCRAINKFNPSGADQNLEFKKATVPEMPKSVTVTQKKPTLFVLSIETPANNGGQPVLSYEIKSWKMGDDSGTAKQVTVNRATNDETITTASVAELEANTEYFMEVAAVTSVGRGIGYQLRAQTETVSHPEAVMVTSSREGQEPTSYTLTWLVPLDGGADIVSYSIKYARADVDTSSGQWALTRAPAGYDTVEVNEGQQISYTLTGLMREAFYHVRIVAVNRIGESPVSEFIFKTGTASETALEEDDEEAEEERESEDIPVSTDPGLDSKAIHDAKSEDKMTASGSQGGAGAEASLGTGGILGVILVLLLVLVVAVDVAFYKTKQCGLTWTIRKALCPKDEEAAASSKSPEDGDEAATKLLGKEKEDSLKTENEVAKEAEPAEEVAPEPQEKELEPEDKEEKLAEPMKAEEPEEAKAKTPTEPEAEAPAAETAPEATPAVETQPASEEKPDATATA